MKHLIVFIIIMLSKEKIAYNKIQEYASKKGVENLLISKDSKLLLHYSLNKKDQNPLVSLHSVTKSILSILIGISIEKGLIKSVDQRIIEYFPKLSGSIIDCSIKEITIKHLLTMTSGIQYKLNNISDQSFLRKDNPIKSILTSSTLEYKPGKLFNYKEIDPHILSSILTKVTNKSTLQFAEENLFRFMEIENVEWMCDKQGINYGGNGLKMSPTDLYKIGKLVLNEGVYKDYSLINRNWLTESIEPHISYGAPLNESYGYYWWISKVMNYKVFFGFGAGGQFLYIIPELKLVVITTKKFDSGVNVL